MKTWLRVVALLICSASTLYPTLADEVPVQAESLAQLLEQLIIAKGADTVAQNIKASEKESGDIDKAVRATLGISIKDINQYGLLGGPNSEMRKLFNALGIK